VTVVLYYRSKELIGSPLGLSIDAKITEGGGVVLRDSSQLQLGKVTINALCIGIGNMISYDIMSSYDIT
jgi:hypothetical protein